MSFENPGDGQLCDHCDRPGTPYEYRGEQYSGLHAYHHDRICDRCLDAAYQQDVRRIVENAPITIRSPDGWS